MGPVRRRFESAALVSAMIVTATNIPVGATVLGLWTASLVAAGEPITMAAVATFLIVAGGAGVALTLLLGWLGSRHDRVMGRGTARRRRSPWLRAMSGERVMDPDDPRRFGALDVVCVVVVVAAVIAFEAWFLFFSGSPLDGRTGRG